MPLCSAPGTSSFPRSQGARWDEENQKWISGTFDTSHERLEAAAAMGFDVVYLPPIHPIGRSFRKGPNNTLTPGPADPGSPWAIGAAEGGHDAIHPDLGDFDAFDRFVAKAKSLGLEVAMDFALQASPDHPWVTEHPEWFSKRADGSIAYAENPPKKYQDIYPINFDNDRDGIYLESLRILKLWMSHGVRIFRVDNPHTKPVNFWAWLLAEIRKTDPDVLFLAEAFTKPAMMHALGKVGYQQSYTYFTWRNEKWEIEEYMKELTTETDSFFRPSFWPNTSRHPAPLPAVGWQAGIHHPRSARLRRSRRCGASIQASSCSRTPPLGQGREEYLDSEKFQYRPRDWKAAEESGETLSMLLGKLNQIRKEHPALQQLRDLHFHHAPHADALVYSKKERRRRRDRGRQRRSAQHRRDRGLPGHGGAGTHSARRLPCPRRAHRTNLALGTACLRQAHPRRSGAHSHTDPVRLAEHGLWAGYHTGLGRRRERDGRSSGRRPGPEVHLQCAMVRRQGPAGPAPIADALPWLTEVSDFFRPAAPPAVRFEIAEVTYPA